MFRKTRNTFLSLFLRMNKFFVLLLISVSFISSCKKDDGDTVLVTFNIKSTHKTIDGRSYGLDSTQTRILFSDFKYVDGSGNETLVKDVFLYQLLSNNQFSFKYPKGNYSSFKFSFGLDKNTNNSIPMTFASSNPLSVENGMYWDMLKYRFLIVEGKIDNSVTKDQIPASPFSMHLGTDTMHAEIVASVLPYINNTLMIELDMDKLFALDADPFQITNFSNHSEPSEIQRGVAIKNSFVNSIKTTLFKPD